MIYYEDNYLMHHGIKGQKWGLRRFQNADGTLTAAGKARYGTREAFEAKQKAKAAWKDYSKSFNKAYDHNHPYSLSKKWRQASEARWEEAGNKAEAYNKAKADYKSKKVSAKERRRLALEEQNYKRYGKDNLPGQGIVKHYVDNAKYWKSTMKDIDHTPGFGNRAKKFANAFLDQPMTLTGFTGTSETTLRKRLSGQSYEIY